jgi:hypothetical protein
MSKIFCFSTTRILHPFISSFLSKCEIRSLSRFLVKHSFYLFICVVISRRTFPFCSVTLSGRLRWGCKGKLYFVSTKSFSKFLVIYFLANYLEVSGLDSALNWPFPLLFRYCFKELPGFKPQWLFCGRQRYNLYITLQNLLAVYFKLYQA